MFERYTESARRVLFFSRDEASRLGSISIEPEHLLLGLLRDSEAIAVLATVSLGRLREDTETKVVFRKKLATSVEIPFAAGSKRVLQFAAEEADALLHNHIGAEHLLLGLLREEHSHAAAALGAHGVRLSDVRQAVKTLSGQPGASPAPGIQMAVEKIRSLVADLAATPRDRPEARELVTRIDAALDALLNDSGIR